MDPVQVILDLVAVMGSGPEASTEGYDFAWRVIGLLDGWTGKVDTKASIALAVESAVFGFVVTRPRDEGEFAGLSGCSEVAFYVGLAFLLAAVICSLLVIVPRLNRRASEDNSRSNMIYFGSLRHWGSQELSSALTTGGPYEDQLATQMITMANIAWRKHAWLQASLVSLALATLTLIAVAVTS